MERDEILALSAAMAATQEGGTLATTHAEDGTPYVTFVLFHMRGNGEILFGSNARVQHARNMAATPEVSFLIDNREVLKSDWNAFDRIVIEGRAAVVAADDARYEPLVEELAQKNHLAARFTRGGMLFCLRPRRLMLMKGLEAARHTVDYSEVEAGAGT